jgi:hypothetical protein
VGPTAPATPRLPQYKTPRPRPIRETFHAACSSVLPIFQGYNQDAAWREIFAEKLRLYRQKDPL